MSRKVPINIVSFLLISLLSEADNLVEWWRSIEDSVSALGKRQHSVRLSCSPIGYSIALNYVTVFLLWLEFTSLGTKVYVGVDPVIITHSGTLTEFFISYPYPH